MKVNEKKCMGGHELEACPKCLGCRVCYCMCLPRVPPKMDQASPKMPSTVYRDRGTAVGELVDRKQVQYGDAFGKSGQVLGVLYPNGIAPHQYGDALAVVRVLDKLFRIAQRGPDCADLGGESPWQDIAGYGLLGAAADDRRRAILATDGDLEADE